MFSGVLPVVVSSFYGVKKNLVSLVDGLGSLLGKSLLPWRRPCEFIRVKCFDAEIPGVFYLIPCCVGSNAEDRVIVPHGGVK